MQLYSCGFLFCPDRLRVLLIRKKRPMWQVGKLNGIGGKVEPGESPLQAMVREFSEEAGMHITDWQELLQLTGPDWRGHFFRAFGNIDQARNMTDEALEIVTARQLPTQVLPNLNWIIPMMLDEGVARADYRVNVSASPFSEV